MANPSASRDALIGQLVGGRYEVVRLIGKGGTGAIYEVRNIRLGHSFALKTLTSEAAANEEAVQRFRREADIVARIKHPNIVEVIDWDELPDGSPCIVMEYLRGGDLATRMEAHGALPWPHIAVIADQVLAALTTTHAANVVHRDLKPHNVFIAVDDSGEERVKLLDFGVSKIRDSKSFQTMNDRLVGTPSYMAPEQAEGRSDEVGPHTDIWAMAVILHEMATGKRAFDAPSLPAILYAVCHGDPVPIAEYRPDAPAAFVALIDDSLRRPIAERLASAATMRARLREALRDVAGVDYTKMPPLRAPTPAPRASSDAALADTVGGAAAAAALAEPTRSRSRWPFVAGIGALLVGGGVTAAVLLGGGTRGRNESPPVTTPVVADVVAHDAAVAEPVVPEDAAVAEPAAPVDAAIATPDAGTRPSRPPRPPTSGSFVDQVTAAVSRRMSSLGECIAKHPEATVSEVNATIDIAPEGRARNVTLAPASVATTPLGQCLRAGLMAVPYPASEHGGKVAFPLRTRAR